MVKQTCIVAAMACASIVSDSTYAQSETARKRAQRVTRQLSGVQALQTRLARADTYRATSETLTAMIWANVEQHRASGSDDERALALKDALERARSELRENFETIYGRAIDEVGQSLDPLGDYELTGWLSEYANDPPDTQQMSLKERGRQQYEGYLASQEFATLYAAARKRVAEDQVREIQPGLDEDDFPTADDIERVYVDPASRVGIVATGRGVLIGNRILLAEAEQAVETLAAEMVAKGVAQLEEQLRVLSQAYQAWENLEDPTSLPAHTPAGMEKALNGELAAYLQSFKPVPGFKAFPEFPLAKARQGELALHLFDRRVADQAAEAKAALETHALRLPEAYGDKLQAEILRAPYQHHTLSQSKTVLEPLVLETVLSCRAWISDPLAQDAAAPTGHFDPNDVGEAIRRAVEKRIDIKGTLPNSKWNLLSEAVREECYTVMVATRSEIAEDQAREHCPKIASGEWKPQETLILATDSKSLSARTLRGIEDVWTVHPPTKEQVLEETWRLWIQNASDAFALGRQALNRQRWHVGDLERHFTSQITEKQKGGTGHWVKEYTERVRARWREDASPAASRYRELFKATVSEIDRVVGEALNRTAKEAQAECVDEHVHEIEGGVQRQRERRVRPEFDPHYERYVRLVDNCWKKHELANEHPDLFQQTILRIRGIVQKCVRAEIEKLEEFEKDVAHAVRLAESATSRLKGGVPAPKQFCENVGREVRDTLGDQAVPPEVEQRLRRLEEEAEVLILQSQLVDDAKPGIEAGIADSIRRRQDPTVAAWEREYRQRVESEWKRRDLAQKKEFEGLLPAIRQRLHGIVTQLIEASQFSIEALIRSRQQALVDRHESYFANLIRADAKPIRSAYEDRYAAKVSEDWQDSREDRALFLRQPALVRETVDYIRGKVARYIPESVASLPEPEPPRPTSRALARDPTQGEREEAPAQRSQAGAYEDTARASDASGDQSDGGRRSGGGGGSDGQGGTVSPDLQGGDMAIPKPEKEPLSNSWLWLLLLLIAVLCILVVAYLLYRRGKLRGKSRSGSPLGGRYRWLRISWWLHLSFRCCTSLGLYLWWQPLFWRIVWRYGRQTRDKLRPLIQPATRSPAKALPAPNDQPALEDAVPTAHRQGLLVHSSGSD